MEKIILDKFQEDAIKCTLENHSVIVSAPTGAGKTLIAEHVIDNALKNHRGVIYTAPIKALSNQKFRDFTKAYSENKVGIVTGDISINRRAPILIMTTEVFRNVILVEPELFENRDWVIFDEIHYLDDIERGTVWEEAIILLPNHMKMLALSATIPNIDEFVQWIKKIHNHPITSIVENNRPVPLHLFFQCDNKIYTNFENLESANILQQNLTNPSYQEKYLISSPNRMNSLLQHISNNQAYPCIYFSFSRRKCEEFAQDACSFDFLSKQEKTKINKKFNKLLKKFNVTSSPHINILSYLIKKGIAYHHAGLLPTLKEIIEQLFTSGLIKLIFTTETFALGINMPARAVIFDSLSKYYGGRHTYLKTRDFYQMAGRAGRRGIDKEGYVFSRINPSHIDLISLKNTIYGKYEPIKSQLNSCYATILNLYKIMGDRIFDIYPKSFHFYQSQMWEKKAVLELLNRKMDLLKDSGYIIDSKITKKAELASTVYSFELIIGELFENNYFNNLHPEDLFVIITALVYEPRKGYRPPKFNKKTKYIKKELSSFSRRIHGKEKFFRISPLTKKFYFDLTEASIAWFQGAKFHRLTKICNKDEGEIVRYFRMAL
ncbi:MAG: DEAD/DEAH box helicase, partial [Candidatus Omnitrophica bacterium]|nr:DEAD/DEAH box helicase [Candidatus Omnitrophota bacterium]